jgi:hypothetical protein
MTVAGARVLSASFGKLPSLADLSLEVTVPLDASHFLVFAGGDRGAIAAAFEPAVARLAALTSLQLIWLFFRGGCGDRLTTLALAWGHCRACARSAFRVALAPFSAARLI